MKKILIFIVVSIPCFLIAQSNLILQVPEINSSYVFDFLNETVKEDEETLIVLDGINSYQTQDDVFEFYSTTNSYSLEAYPKLQSKNIVFSGISFGSGLIDILRLHNRLTEMDSVCNTNYQMNFSEIINRGILDKCELVHQSLKEYCQYTEIEILLFDMKLGRITCVEFLHKINNFRDTVIFITMNPMYEDIKGYDRNIFVANILVGQQGQKNKVNKIKNADRINQFAVLERKELPKKIYLNYWFKSNVYYFDNANFLFLKSTK